MPGSNPPAHVASTYTVHNNVLLSVMAQTASGSDTVALTYPGVIAYNIVDRTQTITADHFDVVVLPAATPEFSGPGSATGYAERDNVTTVAATTPTMPVGSYRVVIFCENFADDCILGATVTATY
jgi:hypothetical protein